MPFSLAEKWAAGAGILAVGEDFSQTFRIIAVIEDDFSVALKQKSFLVL